MAAAELLKKLKSTRLVSHNAGVEALCRSNEELEKSLEDREQYSRDFNIGVLGINKDEGEECMKLITDFITTLGSEDAAVEVENAHPKGKNEMIDKPIIIELSSRPFKRKLLQAAKSVDGKAILEGVRIVEDFTSSSSPPPPPPSLPVALSMSLAMHLGDSVAVQYFL